MLLTTPSDVNSTHIVIHRVDCDGELDYHDEHDQEEHYYDVPRLRANSNRTTPLRGLHPLSSPEWLLEDHPSIPFVVRNIYDCGGYHEKLMDQFERLWMPLGMSGHVSAQVRPYYSVLMKDAAPAERKQQVLVPSKGLTRTMTALKSSHPTSLHEWDTEQNLTYPYLQLWHCKDELQDASNRLADSTQKLHLQALLNYLEVSAAAEWHEAEQLFAQGLVNKKHWAKLYRPNDLIVTMRDDEPLAFIAKDCRSIDEDHVALKCWSWDFDGEFYLREISPTVEWPSKSDIIKISELAYFPLRFDNTGLEKRLKYRGEIFWSCRKRKYVSYSVASNETSDRSVSSFAFPLRVKNTLMFPEPNTIHGRHEDI
ncbi:hypothetical protein C7974DRAFT_33979 [Boeremia exigua]|uniref:uncharacterized protein n=1 Tax=Boeremia exigua TaxID=749465 RepID=UPI001E8CC78A|nr:uncharacterized protein C7974DRAFT_33979 [Boeremia exigua]KAH6618648.1 hypothetical protein C7974DRAFT_33979 [Boeremia exigua]